MTRQPIDESGNLQPQWLIPTGVFVVTLRSGDRTNAYAAGWVTRISESPVVVQVAAKGFVPTSYALNQNYPNPFNPSTEIAFALPQSGHVTLTVYNILGQAVKTLADEEMSAGPHQVTWDGSANGGSVAASGIYFYRLQANDFVATKKMTLLK